MKWYSLVVVACSLSFAVPTHANSHAFLTAEAPSPIPTIVVTPPPLFPGMVPVPPQSPTPTAASTVQPTAKPVSNGLFGGLRLNGRTRPTPTPLPIELPVPVVPAETPTPSPTPSPLHVVPDLPTPINTPLRVLIHALPLATPATKFSARPANLPDSNASVKPPASRDKAYDLVGGKWTCRTFASTPLSHRYRRDDDGLSLIVETDVKVRNREKMLVEVYRHRLQTGMWSVSLGGGQFVAVAEPWTGDTWTFHGIDSDGTRAIDSTMVYMRSGVDSFTRSFKHADRSGDKVYAGETCLRVPP